MTPKVKNSSSAIMQILVADYVTQGYQRICDIKEGNIGRGREDKGRKGKGRERDEEVTQIE